MEELTNLNNDELALVCASKIVEAEIMNNWDFSEESPKEVVLYIAQQFYDFLSYSSNVALTCATRIVIAEMRKGWDFSEVSPAEVALNHAREYNDFLH